MQFLLPKTVQLIEGVMLITSVPQERVQDLLCTPCSEMSVVSAQKPLEGNPRRVWYFFPDCSADTEPFCFNFALVLMFISGSWITFEL